MDFENTKAYKYINDFLANVNKSIQTDKQHLNNDIITLLEDIQVALNKTEIETVDSRYGNPALRVFMHRLSALPFITNLRNSESDKEAEYLSNSFGNLQRLDYGTGHELNFLCFLYIKWSNRKMRLNEVFRVLDFYFDLTRKIIGKFNLEPAGSHGAWGIDDYQLLPFLLGSSELCSSDYSFDDLLNPGCNYTYSKAIRFVNQQKTKYRKVPFKLHSPLIYSLSQKRWAFVNHELMDRYRKDVLESKAVNQHFIYSSYLPNDVYIDPIINVLGK